MLAGESFPSNGMGPWPLFVVGALLWKRKWWEKETEEDDPEKGNKSPQLAEELQRRLQLNFVKFWKKARHDCLETAHSSYFFHYL